MSAEIRAALKGREPLIYARVSTKKQFEGGSLDRQIEEVKDALKTTYGIKREPRVFTDVMSGNRPSGIGKDEVDDKPLRKGLHELKEYAMARPNKVVIVNRDTQRFARNPWLAGAEYWPLYHLGIPMVSTLEGQVAPSYGGDLLMPILTAVGYQEISLRGVQTKSGMEASPAWDGQLLDLYSDEPLNPYRELKRLMPHWPPKGVKADKSKGELGPTIVAGRIGKTTSWAYDARDRIHRILDAGGESLLKEWFDAVDSIRAMEAEHGFGIKSRLRKTPQGGKRMRAVRRATGGFIAEPWEEKWARPTAELITLAFNEPGLFKTAKEKRKGK